MYSRLVTASKPWAQTCQPSRADGTRAGLLQGCPNRAESRDSGSPGLSESRRIAHRQAFSPSAKTRLRLRGATALFLIKRRSKCAASVAFPDDEKGGSRTAATTRTGGAQRQAFGFKDPQHPAVAIRFAPTRHGDLAAQACCSRWRWRPPRSRFTRHTPKTPPTPSRSAGRVCARVQRPRCANRLFLVQPGLFSRPPSPTHPRVPRRQCRPGTAGARADTVLHVHRHGTARAHAGTVLRGAASGLSKRSPPPSFSPHLFLHRCARAMPVRDLVKSQARARANRFLFRKSFCDSAHAHGSTL